MFSISFRKHRAKKKENNFFNLIIKMQILFARAIVTSTARASSSVFPSSYRKTIFNQSARAYFFMAVSNCRCQSKTLRREIVLLYCRSRTTRYCICYQNSTCSKIHLCQLTVFIFFNLEICKFNFESGVESSIYDQRAIRIRRIFPWVVW